MHAGVIYQVLRESRSCTHLVISRTPSVHVNNNNNIIIIIIIIIIITVVQTLFVSLVCTSVRTDSSTH